MIKSNSEYNDIKTSTYAMIKLLTSYFKKIRLKKFLSFLELLSNDRTCNY